MVPNLAIKILVRGDTSTDNFDSASSAQFTSNQQGLYDSYSVRFSTVNSLASGTVLEPDDDRP